MEDITSNSFDFEHRVSDAGFGRTVNAMRVVVVASQKGGSGKTTLSGHLAVQADRAGYGQVAVIDTDPQGSLAAWWNAREAESPVFVQSSLSTLSDDLLQLRSQGFKLVVIDTPPAITEAITSVVAHADLVVLPTRPSPHDLRAVGATIDILEAQAKAMVFVLNAATKRAKITGEAAVALSQHGTVAPVTVHQRVNFAASMIDGRTVMEVEPEGASAREVEELWAYLEDRLQRRHLVAVPAEVSLSAAGERETARTFPVLPPALRPSVPFGRRSIAG